MVAIKRRKTFRVFEAGVGDKPLEFMRKAARANELDKKREAARATLNRPRLTSFTARRRAFMGVDPALKIMPRTKITPGTMEQIAKEAGLRIVPRNSVLLEKNAVNEVKKLRKGSYGIVFAGLTLHQIIRAEASHMHGLEKAREYLNAAKEALLPGGRIVLVQYAKDLPLFEQLCLSLIHI